jgi:cytochrome c biogenesis protein CcdA
MALCMILGSLLVRADQPVVRVFFFYSQTCSHCQVVLSQVLPPLQERYGAQLEVRGFDIAATQNYEDLLALEKRFGVTAPDIPEIFVGSKVLIGEEVIRAEFDALIAEGLRSGGVDFPQPDLLSVAPATPTAAPAPTGGPQPTETLPAQYAHIPPEGCRWCNPKTYGDKPIVYMAYLYDTSCRACDRAAYDLNLLRTQYPNLYIRSIDIQENATLGEALGERYGVPAGKRLVTPAVFLGDDYLVTPDVTVDRLTALVGKYAASGSKPPWEGVTPNEAQQSILERFRSFSFLTVIGAGLLDGINPCAFAGMIFFVSYLAVTKRKGREILFVGATYTLGVFTSYLLVGLGILGFVKSLSFIRTFSRIVYLGTMVICGGLAVLSFYDYIQVRRGRKEDTALRLPKPLQERLHRVIRERSRMRSFVAAAAGTGFLVSLIEFACTGQVYLPTIIFVTGVRELRGHAVAYLVLYNLMFVTPLVIIFLLTFFGTTWRSLNRFLESNVATLKLLTAVLFAVLAVWLGVYIL